MKNTIPLLLMALLLLVSMSGCFLRVGPETTSTSASETKTPAISSSPETQPDLSELPSSEPISHETIAPVPPSRTSSEEQLAVRFVDTLLRKDYGAALTMLSSSVYPNSTVFEEDIQWALPRTDFKVLEGIDPDSAEYSTVLDHNGNVLVTVCDANGAEETVTVRTEVPREGDGIVLVNGSGEFYRTRFAFRTPGGVQVEIHGTPVDPSCITKKNTGSLGLYTDWLLPVIGIQDKTIRVYCDNFDASMSFTPIAWSDPQKDESCRFMPDDREEEVLLAVKSLWNSVYTAASANDAKPSDLYPYLASDADPDLAISIYEAVRSIDPDCQNLKMSQAVFRADGECFWVTNRCLVVNFGYELTWDFYGVKDMRRKSHVILALEEDGWKLYRLTDSSLFSYTNSFTHES